VRYSCSFRREANIGTAKFNVEKVELMLRGKSWSSVGFDLGREIAVPERAGVYVLARVSRQYGLPVTFEVLYVGRSKNFRRRYREHAVLHEPNPALNRLVISDNQGVEFWYAVMDVSQTSEAERELIRHFLPSANRIQYKGGVLPNNAVSL
jgi:hypothetical protein